MSEYLNISELVGKTLINIVKSDDNDEIRFYTKNGEVYLMYHEQDCCESVFIEDICGDLDDLIGSPIVMAEEVIEERPPLDEWDESYTWTFYKFATNKGYVTIRWYGTSNGYYSESVDFIKVKEESETAEESDDVLTVDETEASKSVLDLLANLAQRVAELERQQKENDDEYTVEERVSRLERTFTEYMRRVNTIETDIEELNIDLGTVEENVEMILDDIVTLDERTQPLVTFMKAVKSGE